MFSNVLRTCLRGVQSHPAPIVAGAGLFALSLGVSGNTFRSSLGLSSPWLSVAAADSPHSSSEVYVETVSIEYKSETVYEEETHLQMEESSSDTSLSSSEEEATESKVSTEAEAVSENTTEEKAEEEEIDLFMLQYLDIPAIEEKIKTLDPFTEEDLKNVPKNPYCEFCNSVCSVHYLGSIACHHVAVNAGMEEYGQPDHCLPYYIDFMKCYAPIVEAMKEEEERLAREKSLSKDSSEEEQVKETPAETQVSENSTVETENKDKKE